MPDPIEAVAATLTKAGAIRAGPVPRALNRGNRDRAEERLHFRATLADGAAAIVTVSPDAPRLAARQRELARALPGLAVAPLAEWQVDGICAVAQPWFEGRSLEEVAEVDAATARRAFAAAVGMLGTAVEASDESVRRAEFTAWAEEIAGLPCWESAAAIRLREEVLPRLQEALAGAPPTRRWSNGDFTASNLLVGPAGEVRLIDAEFAHRTHFHAEDAARFFALSPCARRQPGLFDVWPQPGWAVQLFFWLRQLHLEHHHNTADYVGRILSRRLAVIRQLIEVGLDCPPPAWPVAAAATAHHIEQARWNQSPESDVDMAGWCYARGEAAAAVLAATAHEVRATAPLLDRADVAAHFGAAEARRSGFHLAVAGVEPADRIVLALLTAEGEMLPFKAMAADSLPGRGPRWSGFGAWYARHDPVPSARPAAAGPLFSLLIPIHRTPRPLLEACLQSVLAQHHPHWEACLVDDSGEPGEWREAAESFARQDPRFRLQVRPERGGIARATNDALRLARGEFIALLDHDDELRPHALAEFARVLAERPATDALYSDEAVVTRDGRPWVPFLKPAWSPEFLRGVMYVGHLLAVRTGLARAAGGFDPDFDGVQDFEFMLRVGERTHRIEHVPRILYHWRQSPGSSALNGNVKGDMDARQLAAVERHLARRGDPRRAAACGGHRVHLRTGGPVAFRRIADRAALVSAEDRDEVLVFAAEHVALDDEGARELAALAAWPDSGVVAAVLVGPDGRVASAGHTTATVPPQPLMTGFDAGGDGFNGSLRCNREIGAVGPDCFAVRRSLGPELSGEPDWWQALARLTAKGLRHRVCSVVHARVAAMPAAQTFTPDGADPWFNPHFDPVRRDYSLRRPPVHFSSLRWHLDMPIPSRLPDGCLDLRGWAAGADDETVTLRFRAGGIDWPLSCHQVRPDVNAALGRPAGAPGGFRASFRLPPGRHAASLESGSASTRQILWQGTIQVPAGSALRRTWRTPPQPLLACQLPAGPTDMPRTVEPERFPARQTTPHGRPRLAIVTPSYQQARSLEETMRSVLEQPGVAGDYVVQDGGSTDGTPALLKRWAEQGQGRKEKGEGRRTKGELKPEAGNTENGERRKEESRSRTDATHPSPSSPLPSPAGVSLAWSSEADGGQADAIAKGFAKTSGGPDDVMAWINSDDFYLPGALRFVADYFARHPEVDVIYGHRVLVDENSQEIGRWYLPKHDAEVLRLNDFVPQETLFWRRRIWDKAGGIDTSFKFALDWDLLLRFQEAGAKIVRVPYFLACFRIHAAQKTSAQMHSVGQEEIDRLRERTFGRRITPAEIENHPRLIRYLRKSAWIETMWKLGIRWP